MAWHARECTGQVPQGRHSASLVAHGDELVLFGGTSTALAFNDVHVLNTKTWAWRKVECGGNVPTGRWGHRAHVIPGTHTMIVHGGCDVDNGPLAAILLLDLGTWEWSRPTSVSGSTPTARAYHSSAVVGGAMYVFGGEPAPRDNNVYALDLREFCWSTLPAGGQTAAPEPRKKCSLVAHDGCLYALGGVETGRLQYMEDLRILDLSSGKWSDARANGAVPGSRAGMVAEVIDDKLIMWGGIASKGLYPNEIHQYNLGSRSWFKRRGSGPIPIGRAHHCGAVSAEGELVVFGGISSADEKVSLNDVYTLGMSLAY
eukprot:m51a1_g6620 hypothetical protein (315) ;mRNA; r:44740-46098